MDFVTLVSNYFSKALDKILIEIDKIKKNLNVPYQYKIRLIFYYLDFFVFYLYSLN